MPDQIGSEFDGKWDGIFISIGAILLTIVTLGLGWPWANVMVRRWYWQHCVISGKRVSFHGTGGEFFVQYLIIVLLSIITIGIYAIFFAGPRIRRWEIKNLSFEVV